MAASSEAPAVACVSEHQAKAWRRLVQVDAILRPLVPTSAIRFSPAAGNGAVFAGRFSPEKGAAEAIEIARAAGVQIELFGDSYDDEYTRRRIAPRGAEPDVSVHASVPRTSLWRVMARAAVVLCPVSWDEPFGMVAAEAQACGTPVVAFRRGALAEVVVDRVTGFLIAPGDLGAATEAVLGTPGLSRLRCREHAERRLDLGCTLDAHERLYEQLAGARVGAASSG
jgi:glycosyltransferase involved in cell wall biosynthesis